MIKWFSQNAGTPISLRKRDWLFVVAFGFFITTSILTDSVNGLNGALTPDSPYIVERFIYDTYARVADPLLILNPPQVRVSAWISAFIWLPLYVLFVAGFLKGWNRIRPFGLVYGGALTHGMITYMAQGIFGEMAQSGWATEAVCVACTEPNTLYYLSANSAYLIIPALMIVRMWKPDPFGTPSEAIPSVGEVMVDLTTGEPVVYIDGQEVASSVAQTADEAEQSQVR